MLWAQPGQELSDASKVQAHLSHQRLPGLRSLGAGVESGVGNIRGSPPGSIRCLFEAIGQ